MPRSNWLANSAMVRRRWSLSNMPIPCGVATGETLIEAYRAKLWNATAFRPLVELSAVNRPLDGATAEAITEIFTEVVAAPGCR